MKKAFSLLRSTLAFGLGPLVALITAPVLAHTLGPAGRGQLAAILQPLTIADSLAAFGIPAAVAYFVARGRRRAPVRRLALKFIALPVAVAYIALLLYGLPLSQSQNLPYPAIALTWTAVAAGAFVAVRRAELSGGQSWRLLDAERSVTALGRLAAICLLAAVGFTSVIAFAVAPLVTGVAASLLILFVVTKFTHRDLSDGEDATDVPSPEFLRYAGAASLGTLTFALSARIDQLVLPLVVPSEQLGYYVVAVTVSEVTLIIGMVLSRNLLAETAANGPNRAVALTLGMGVGAASVLAITLASIAPFAIPMIFGAAFEQSIAVTQVLSFAAVFSVATAGLAAIMNGLGRPLTASLAYAAPITAMLLYASVARSSVTITGAASVMLCGQVAATVLLAAIFAFAMRARRRSDGGH